MTFSKTIASIALSATLAGAGLVPLSTAASAHGWDGRGPAFHSYGGHRWREGRYHDRDWGRRGYGYGYGGRGLAIGAAAAIIGLGIAAEANRDYRYRDGYGY
jgi:hypothetical protein